MARDSKKKPKLRTSLTRSPGPIPRAAAAIEGLPIWCACLSCESRAPGGDFGDMAYQGLAMKFLIENDVRQKASQKLQAEVAALLKREDI